MRNSIIRLLNCSMLDVNYNHTVNFKSIENQIAWFQSKTQKIIDDNTYTRLGENIRVNMSIQQLDFCNYVMTKNEGEQWKYYFIIDKVYVNDNMTILVLKLDVFQTYYFNLNFNLHESFIDRQHVQRWNGATPNIKDLDIPENLEIGEYVIKSIHNIYSYNNKGGFIVTASDKLSKKIGTTSNGNNNGTGGSGGGSSASEMPENPSWGSMTTKQQNFISLIYEGANKGYKDYNLFASVTIAQAILETGWNCEPVGNNLFGIKASPDWTGKTVTVETWEDYGNGPVQIIDTFRAYDTISDSVLDRCKFLRENSNYVNAGVFTAKTYTEQCQALKNAGYATDPAYVSKLVSIIESYDLYVYDIK